MDNKLNSIMWIFSNFREDRMAVFYFRNKFENLALGLNIMYLIGEEVSIS